MKYVARGLYFLMAIFLAMTPAFPGTEEALQVADPLVFAPNDFTVENVKLDTPLSYEFLPGSMEWVRLNHLVTVPRARVRLHLLKDGSVSYRGKTYFSHQKTVELLITLLEEPENKIEIFDPAQKIAILFKNTKNFRTRVALDSTCSPYAIFISDVAMPAAWATVFCQAVHPLADRGYGFQLEVKVLWQSESTAPLFSEFALDSRNSETKIAHGQDTFTLETHLPEKFHPLSVSAGVGPYLQNTILRPFFTLYAGYTLNEQLRLASFSAVPVGDSPHLDQGFYLITEQAKGLDDRLSVNLLLGAHFVQFNTEGSGYVRFSAPQGIEFQLRDFLSRRNTVTAGTFYYPEINGTSYINGWARFGWGSGFVEVNYIRWQEAIDTGSYSAKSFGISYGLPLFRAL